MNKNHSPKFSDEQLERLARAMLQSALLADEVIEETAASPHLWRQLQRRITEEKSRRDNRWFFIRRWQTAAWATLLLFGAMSGIRLFTSPRTEIADARVGRIESFAANESDSTQVTQTTSSTSEKITSPAKNRAVLPVKAKKDPARLILKPAPAPFRSIARKPTIPKTDRPPKTESATEFIALSYLPVSESGQVVRVKVPRSMLVSLGVSTNIEREKELINAEVIVGDDGAAQAIRFLNN